MYFNDKYISILSIYVCSGLMMGLRKVLSIRNGIIYQMKDIKPWGSGFLSCRVQLQSLKRSSSYLQNKYRVCKNLPWIYHRPTIKSFISTISSRRFHWSILSWDWNTWLKKKMPPKPNPKSARSLVNLYWTLTSNKLENHSRIINKFLISVWFKEGILEAWFMFFGGEGLPCVLLHAFFFS